MDTPGLPNRSTSLMPGITHSEGFKREAVRFVTDLGLVTDLACHNGERSLVRTQGVK